MISNISDHLRTRRSADHGHHAAPFGHGAPFGHAPLHHAPVHHAAPLHHAAPFHHAPVHHATAHHAPAYHEHTPIHQELHLNHGPVHHAPVHHEPGYGHAPHHAPNPISTFVKTDPHANFKWGVKHLAGVQYGK